MNIFNSCTQEETDSDCTDPLAIKVILDTEQDNKLALDAVINELESGSVNVRASISF